MRAEPELERMRRKDLCRERNAKGKTDSMLALDGRFAHFTLRSQSERDAGLALKSGE